MYKRLCETLESRGILIPSESNPFDHIKSSNISYYLSTFDYTEEQFKAFKKEGTISAVRDEVVGNTLYWDLDSGDNVELAQKDAATLCTRLIETGIDADDLQICFSGGKGFHVALKLDSYLPRTSIESICKNIAHDLESFDVKVYNTNRILRLIYTKHENGLYKMPLTFNKLNQLNIDQIKKYAASLQNLQEWDKPSFRWAPITLNSKLSALINIISTKPLEINRDYRIDFVKKPKGWTNCKWALAQGYTLKDGDRTEKVMAIIATCHSLNYTKEQSYYITKNALKIGEEHYGAQPYDKTEIWTRVEYVYGPTWTGGAYSCKNNANLKAVCDSLGAHSCTSSIDETVKVEKVFDLFEDYAVNYDKNVLSTGIKPLDEKCNFMVGTSNAILAPPGVGKTSISLQILNHNSKNNVNCIFFSYDMFHSMVYLRLMQKHKGLGKDAIFELIKANKKEALKVKQELMEEYKNVEFCFKSGQTPDEIQQTILDTEQKIGTKIKLVVIDYNELVITNLTDPTQSSAYTAQRMRQIANDTGTCIISLLQPSKLYSNPADEITTFQGAKGSSSIAQSLSLMLSLSRPGFSPRNTDQDKFFTINALKHRQGPLFTIDLAWDGLRGTVREMSYEESQELAQIRKNKEEEKKKEVKW